MPSPIGHVLGGLLAGFACASPTPVDAATVRARLLAVARSRLAVVPAVAACLPDVDFLWGRHSMETHSLGAAVGAGLVAWLVWRQRRLAVAVALAWASHVFFDWLGSDATPPLGVMAFWPLTSSFFFAEAYVFEAISRRYWLSGFWPHNLRAVAAELAWLGPLVAAAAWWRVRRY